MTVQINNGNVVLQGTSDKKPRLFSPLALVRCLGLLPWQFAPWGLADARPEEPLLYGK